MASSVEIFDSASMARTGSHSPRFMGAGSLTWFDRLDEGWIAGFAHYNDETGEPFKTNPGAGIHTFDARLPRLPRPGASG